MPKVSSISAALSNVILGTPLPNRHGREEDGHQTVLSPRQPVAWMAGNLQHELAVPALVQQAARRRSLDRQSAEDERPGRESDDLLFAFPVLPNHLDRLDLALLPFGDNEVRELLSEKRTCAGKTRIRMMNYVEKFVSVLQSVDPRPNGRLATQPDRAVTELCQNPISLTRLEICF